jgi:predicted HicB family RNase H-like nuclease
MAKSQAQLQAEANLSPELQAEFEVFLEDYRGACQEAGIRPVFNYTTFSYTVRHGWRKTSS